MSFTHIKCAAAYQIPYIIVMYALAHGEDVWPQGRYRALRSRVTNLVTKTYSRVALVDQTGPIMVAPLEWRSCPRACVCARPTHCLPPSARLLRATSAGRGVRSDGVHTTSRPHRGSHVASWLSVEATPRLTPTETSSEPRPCSEPVLAVRAQGQTTSTSTARPLGSTR